jgi:hypothetical protein
MAKKCIKCGVPLEGLMYKIIAKPIFGVKPSKKKKGFATSVRIRDKNANS